MNNNYEMITSNIVFHRNCIIGQGMFGTVYKGCNTENGDMVAVKVISPDKYKQEKDVIDR